MAPKRRRPEEGETGDETASEGDARLVQGDEEFTGAGAGSAPKRAKADATKSRAPFHKVGLIEEVHMQNLRCYKKHDVYLGPGANFIIGQNGSGKSTVAIAVQLALGMKLPRPEKGTSGFVRKGAVPAEAVVEVVLCNAVKPGTNTDHKRYHHEKYGDRILIRRRITWNSEKGTFSDKTETWGYPGGVGKPVAIELKSKDAKVEVERICSRFRISAVNPVMVLDQAASKNFLTGNPVDQYTFFSKATGLTEQYEQICDFRRELHESESVLETSSAQMNETQDRLRKAKANFEQVKELKQLVDKIRRVQYAMLWATVEEQDGIITAKAAKVAENVASIAKGKNARAQLKARLDGADGEEAKLMAELEKVRLDGLQQRARVDEANDAVGEAMRPVLSTNTELTRAESGLEKAKAVLKKKEAAFAGKKTAMAKRKAATNTLSKATKVERSQADRNEAAEALAEAKTAADKRRAEFEELQGEANTARLALNEAKSDLEDATKQVTHMSTLTKAQMQDPLVNYKSKKGTSLTDTVLVIANLIRENASDFDTVPIGPISSLVHIKEPEWARAAEALSHSLHYFVTTSEHDSGVLERLAAKHGHKQLSFMCRPNAARPAAAIRSPPPGMRSLAEILTYDNDIVANVIADDLKPETLLLRENHHDITTLAMKHSTYTFLTSDMFKVQARSGNTGLTETPIRNGLPTPFFRPYVPAGGDVGMQLSSMKKQVEKLKADVEGLRQQVEGQDARCQVAARTSAAEDSNVAKKQALEKAAKAALANAMDLPDDKEDDNDEEEEELRLAEESVSDAQEEVEQCEGRVAEVKAKLVPLKAALVKAQANLDVVQKAGSNAASAPAAAGLEKLTQNKATWVTAIEAIDVKLASFDEKRSIALAEHDGAVEKREVCASAAKAGSGWVEQDAEYRGHSVADLSSSKRALDMKKSIEEKKHGGEGAFERAKAAYDAATVSAAEETKKIAAAKKNVDALRTAYKNGRAVFDKNEIEYAQRISTEFKNRAMAKGHVASVEFVHNPDDRGKGEVVVTIVPDALGRKMGKHASQQAMEISTLSGGEKSFASLILLSAIAQVAEPAFRIIDEFDVFQDEATRKLSITFLLEDARRLAGAETEPPQFILLTPLDVSAGLDGATDLTKSGMLKVMTCKAPREPGAPAPAEPAADEEGM